jgi:methylglyoxal synthase
MVQFCIAYCGILAKHKLCATATTGKLIMDATGLRIDLVLPGSSGGEQQIASRVAYNEVDMVLLFRDPDEKYALEPEINELLRHCDRNSIATFQVILQPHEEGPFRIQVTVLKYERIHRRNSGGLQ